MDNLDSRRRRRAFRTGSVSSRQHLRRWWKNAAVDNQKLHC